MANSNQSKIILVTPNDKPIGTVEKHLGHRFGMLHRAFSVMIFRYRNKQLQLLLQQRSKKKYHGGGLWTNTCCSHPRPGEKLLQAASKRLTEEMGIKAKLLKVGKFHYIAKLDNGMTENEIDHVFVGKYDGDDISVNPNEVDNYKWVDVSTLQKYLKANPESYTPWLSAALTLSLKCKKKILSLKI